MDSPYIPTTPYGTAAVSTSDVHQPSLSPDVRIQDASCVSGKQPHHESSAHDACDTAISSSRVSVSKSYSGSKSNSDNTAEPAGPSAQVPRSRKKSKQLSRSKLGGTNSQKAHGTRLNSKVLTSFRRMNPTLVLENSGSVARDHLASERTFLAYVRTSLAIASTGVALVQLFTIADLTSKSTGVPLSSTSRRVQRFARPLGITCVLCALFTLAIGMHRYFLIQSSLPENKFPVARGSIAFVAFVLSAVVIVIFAALCSGRSEQ